MEKDIVIWEETWRFRKGEKYSSSQFDIDVKEFLLDEKNKRFGKHPITVWKGKKVFAIILWYDLRTLYFFVRIKEDEVIEYVFFDIWDHDAVY